MREHARLRGRDAAALDRKTMSRVATAQRRVGVTRALVRELPNTGSAASLRVCSNQKTAVTGEHVMRRNASAAVAAKASQKTEAENGSHPFVDGLGGATVVEVPIKDIDLDDLTFQCRLSVKTDDLRAAIEREGQLEPIDLTDSRPHRIIDGFRRSQAIRELGWPTIKAIVRRKLSDEAAHEIAFVKNVVRKNLSPMEKANAIRLAEKRGCNPAAIAKEFGLSEKQLRRYERMLDFPKAVQELVDEGHVSMAHAKLLVEFGVTEIAIWIESIRVRRWSAIQLRRELSKALKTRPGSKKREFVKCGDDEVRGYAWRLSKSSSQDERDRAIAALEEALKTLKVFSVDRGPRTRER